MKTALLFLVFAGFAGAQTTPVISSNAGNFVNTRPAIGLVSSGTLAVCTMEVCSNSNVTFGDCNNCFSSSNTLYGVPYETRKLDDKGPSIKFVKASARLIPEAKLAPSEYLARALRIGLSSAGTEEARLLQAIHDTGLHVYEFSQVDAYLYRQALTHGTNYRWVWEPLRERDMKWAGNSFPVAEGGYLYAKQYSREVPDRVLSNIERLMDCAPEETIFMVSDFKAVNPDPFLAVSTPKMLGAGRIFIIDQWDEPGFKESAPGTTIAALSTPVIR